MNSKQMLNWSGIFLLFAAITMVGGLIWPTHNTYVFYVIILSSIFNVGSSIMKGIERMEKNSAGD